MELKTLMIVACVFAFFIGLVLLETPLKYTLRGVCIIVGVAISLLGVIYHCVGGGDFNAKEFKERIDFELTEKFKVFEKDIADRIAKLKNLEIDIIDLEGRISNIYSSMKNRMHVVEEDLRELSKSPEIRGRSGKKEDEDVENSSLSINTVNTKFGKGKGRGKGKSKLE
jgi:hypothetical protein